MEEVYSLCLTGGFMDGVLDDKDLLISILRDQRNSLMDQMLGLQLRIAKMEPLMPKDPINDDQR
jgi:hypothetical protein